MRKFLGAIIVAVFAGVAVAQTMSLATLGMTEMILIGLTVGFSIDYAVSKAKKELSG
jgi:F0F1-type ATP synthase assembly protein I